MKSSFKRYAGTIAITAVITLGVAVAVDRVTSAQPAPAPAGSAAPAATPAPAAAPAAQGSAAPTGTAPAAGSAAPAAGSAAAPAAGTPSGRAWFEELAFRPIDEEGTYWMPKSVNKVADMSDQMFYATLALSAFFFFAITAAVVYLVIKYRHRPGHKSEPSRSHFDALEITWTIIPTIITVFLFYYGWRTYIEVVTPPTKAVEVKVTARQWSWEFVHANGVSDGDLHVPVDTPVRLVMTSTDVLHAFYAPVMRVKQDIIPRRYTYAWFHATKPGTYRLTCAEYCGYDHSQMGKGLPSPEYPLGRRAVVVVHKPGDYERYLADQQALQGGGDPVEHGKRLYEKKGCVTCHSTDGSTKVGPSFKGIWGEQHTMADGAKVTVDESYVRESLMTPSAKTRAGFPAGTMPSFEGQLKQRDIEGIIEFLKSMQ